MSPNTDHTQFLSAAMLVVIVVSMIAGCSPAPTTSVADNPTSTPIPATATATETSLPTATPTEAPTATPEPTPTESMNQWEMVSQECETIVDMDTNSGEYAYLNETYGDFKFGISIHESIQSEHNYSAEVNQPEQVMDFFLEIFRANVFNNTGENLSIDEVREQLKNGSLEIDYNAANINTHNVDLLEGVTPREVRIIIARKDSGIGLDTQYTYGQGVAGGPMEYRSGILYDPNNPGVIYVVCEPPDRTIDTMLPSKTRDDGLTSFGIISLPNEHQRGNLNGVPEFQTNDSPSIGSAKDIFKGPIGDNGGYIAVGISLRGKNSSNP